MSASKLRLKNGYKRFHDLTIDLGATPARIVALVGPNGCVGVDYRVPFGGRKGSSHGPRVRFLLLEGQS